MQSNQSNHPIYNGLGTSSSGMTHYELLVHDNSARHALRNFYHDA